jgi:hypothetical protein
MLEERRIAREIMRDSLNGNLTETRARTAHHMLSSRV